MAMTTDEKTETALLLTVEEAAQLAQVEPEWLMKYARRTKAKWYRRLGHRTTRIEPIAFSAWLTGRR
jgi:hypothetical protein